MLDIQLFGQLEVRKGGTLLPPFPTKKSKSLFAFLVANRGRAYSRDVLAGMFWRDQRDQAARKCLRTAIWRIRSIVESGDGGDKAFLTDRDHALGFNDDGAVRIDVEEFERRLETAIADDVLSPFAFRSLQDALRLYRADFLAGLYDDWVLEKRRRLEAEMFTALDRLIGYCETRQDWSSAIMWGERVVAYDPFREDTHRNLMRFYYLAGNRPAAIRVFENLRKTLRSELRVDPMPETMSLYQQICSSGFPDGDMTRLGAPRPKRKLQFEPPTVRPLVVMPAQVAPVPVGDLLPSTAFRNVSASTPAQ